MPVHVHADIRRLNQEAFGQIAYEVMDHVFAVHNEMGRFFDEQIYRDAVADRVMQSQTEVMVEVQFEDFRRDYYIDLLVGGGAVFELKTINSFGAKQRSQLLNYLLLTNLAHGKLVNFRSQLVEHEFVNTQLQISDRTAFGVTERGWKDPGPANQPLLQWFVAFLRDIGAGLDVSLYENAVSYFFGGDDAVSQEVDIFVGDRKLGSKIVHLALPRWAFKVTTINETGLSDFEDHVRRFLRHTELHGTHWINVTRQCVTFTSVDQSERTD